jgi:hypothetical protein
MNVLLVYDSACSVQCDRGKGFHFQAGTKFSSVSCECRRDLRHNQSPTQRIQKVFFTWARRPIVADLSTKKNLF